MTSTLSPLGTRSRAHLKAFSLAALTGIILTACSTAGGDAATPVPTLEATPAPTAEAEPEPEPTPEVIDTPDPSLEVTIDGVTYTGTEEAPLKIGDDTPGEPPAIEAEFPYVEVQGENPRAIFEAAEAVYDQKYFVYVSGVYANGEFPPEHTAIGYSWGVSDYNEWGSFKTITGHGTTLDDEEPFATQQEAIDAPKYHHGRLLDRSEYVLRTPPNGW